MTRCVFMASATRDFSPQHSNPDYARNRSGTRDVFVNTQFNMGMVSRLATDWAGPSAIVRRVKIKMKENVCAGDDMIVTGPCAEEVRAGRRAPRGHRRHDFQPGADRRRPARPRLRCPAGRLSLHLAPP
jgi:acyl dehydratase